VPRCRRRSRGSKPSIQTSTDSAVKSSQISLVREIAQLAGDSTGVGLRCGNVAGDALTFAVDRKAGSRRDANMPDGCRMEPRHAKTRRPRKVLTSEAFCVVAGVRNGRSESNVHPLPVRDKPSRHKLQKAPRLLKCGPVPVRKTRVRIPNGIRRTLTDWTFDVKGAARIGV
jgi:hypothetical protein